MDPVTHGVLGAACAEALLFKQDKRNVWIVGALAGMAPDLDIFISSNTDPSLFLLYHRHFTHSLSFIPVGSLLVALGFLIFKRFRQNWQITFLAAFIGYATHGLLDACTSYGTLLLWPFSYQRISWDFIAIIDPFFTIPILLGLAWTLIHEERRGVIIGLILAGLFLSFTSFQHSRAIQIAKSYAASQHWQTLEMRAIPVSSTYWRLIYKLEDSLKVGEIDTPLLQKGSLNYFGSLARFKFEDLPAYVKNSKVQLNDLAIFKWFADGFLILVKPNPLAIADGRYLLGSNPLIAYWGLQFLPNNQHARKITLIILEPKK